MSNDCSLCGGHTRPHRREWIRACVACGFLGSTLKPFGGNTSALHNMDEAQRERALQAIRQETLAMVARQSRRLATASNPRLLEVGCGHGWFLELATKEGFVAFGLEPDLPIAKQAVKTGVPVACGLFPDAVADKPSFDVVALNDVLEHLPDLPRIAAGLASCVRPGGLIVVNGPSRDGALYRLGEIADRIGFYGPLNRLWQENLPSAHLSYFRPADLVRLFAAVGAVEVHRSPIPSVKVRGLWSRLRFTKTDSLLVSALQWIVLVALAPALGVLPPDIVLQVFQVKGRQG